MNRYYKRNRLLATIDDTPTMTDQSQAMDTDINVIVKRYGIHGQAPGTSEAAVYQDLSEFPNNLRDIIDTARNIDEHLGALPPQLRNTTFGELLNLTEEQLTAKLTPAEQPPAEETK